MTVELPKDAEGREIPLDTEVLYDKDGKELRVKRIEFDPFNDVWRFVVQKGSLDLGAFYYRPEYVCLEKPTQPDSWEKLEEDLGKIANNPGEVVCAYFGREIEDCEGCKLENCEYGCSDVFLRDVIDRIRKLRGEGDA